jgi:TM2 domain-containing membrane protein YozV
MTSSPDRAHDQSMVEDTGISDKNRLLTLLLAIFFGVFGAHRFYVGKTQTAVAMVLLDLTFVGFAITGIWAVVDALVIAFGEFTDGDGNYVLEWD